MITPSTVAPVQCCHGIHVGLSGGEIRRLKLQTFQLPSNPQSGGAWGTFISPRRFDGMRENVEVEGEERFGGSMVW